MCTMAGVSVLGQDEPPYQRIAADVRARVADGRLRPGDRLPSTRRLAKDHGVALATATKALLLLQRQGIVVSKARSGTVIAAAGPLPAPLPGAGGAAPTPM